MKQYLHTLSTFGFIFILFVFILNLITEQKEIEDIKEIQTWSNNVNIIFLFDSILSTTKTIQSIMDEVLTSVEQIIILIEKFDELFLLFIPPSKKLLFWKR